MMNTPREDMMKMGLASVACALLAYAMFADVPRVATRMNGGWEYGNAVKSQLGIPDPVQAPDAQFGFDPTQPGRTVTYNLIALAKSIRSGTVTVRELASNKTAIEISLSSASQNAVLPAGIYSGGCRDAGSEVQYPLSPVVHGGSVTTLNVNFGAIVGGGAQALKVKQSATDSSVPYAACAELK